MRFVPGLNGVQQNLNGTQTYSNNEGSVTVGTNAGMPSGWPNDLPSNYTGAHIIYSGNSNPQTGQAGAAISYTLQDASAQTVASYYQNGLTEKGWSIESNANMGGQIVIGAKKDGKTFAAIIIDSGDGTVTVTAGLGLE